MINNLQVLQYVSGDVGRLKAREFFAEVAFIEKKIERLIDEKDGMAFTIFHREQVIAIVGHSELWRGVAEVWSVTSDDIIPVRFSFQKLILGMLDTFQEGRNYTRVQFTVREGYAPAQRWAESLGFELEGTLVKYGPDGADHYMYARIA